MLSRLRISPLSVSLSPCPSPSVFLHFSLACTPCLSLACTSLSFPCEYLALSRYVSLSPTAPLMSTPSPLANPPSPSPYTHCLVIRGSPYDQNSAPILIIQEYDHYVKEIYVKTDQNGRTVVEVASTHYVPGKEVQGEEVCSDEQEWRLKQASAGTKRNSESRKSKHQFSNPNLMTSDDALAPTCCSWFRCMLCYLFLILLGGACGAMWSVIGIEVSHGHINAAVRDSEDKLVDSAVSGSTKNDSSNELSR